MSSISPGNYGELLVQVKQRVRSAQYEALKAVNKELIALYWAIGEAKPVTVPACARRDSSARQNLGYVCGGTIGDRLASKVCGYQWFLCS